MVLLAVCGWLVAGCEDQSDGDECDEHWLSVECGVDRMQSLADTACRGKALVKLACCDHSTQIQMSVGWLTVAAVCSCWTAVVHVWWVGLSMYVG